MATQSARQPEPEPEPGAQSAADPSLDLEPDHEPGSDPGSEPEPAAEAEIDPELLERRRHALRFVRKLGDPVLRARAVEIDQFDDQLRDEIDRMGVLMEDAMGVGLAATQLGVLHRLLVYRVQHESPVIALVNPELEWSGGELETMEEGCLSLPGIHVDVERAIHLRVRALDGYGEPVLIEASGLEARVIAHEMDHLDGILILDRTSREQRREAMRAMREAAAAAAGGPGGGDGP
jgi:peptide deformylase